MQTGSKHARSKLSLQKLVFVAFWLGVLDHEDQCPRSLAHMRLQGHALHCLPG